MKKYILILIVSLMISISLISITIISKHNKPIETNIDDSYMAYFVDGKETDKMPEKGNYDVSITCDKGANATWDYDAWAITIYNATKTGTRCSVTFTTKVELPPSQPQLFSGLIPITYDNSNNILIADVSSEWYNYEEHKWANAILIDQSNTTIKNKYLNGDGTFKSGTKVSISDVLQMYVWIPRYKYKLFNVTGSNTSAKMIEVEFESSTTSKSSGSSNGEWLTHPAFTFGDTELNGIWVGKFESSGSASEVKIIPNVLSFKNANIASMFNASRTIETKSKYGLSSSQVDTHMMKNMEWGAVAYLTNSKYGRYNAEGSCISSGCEVWINNNENLTTGCAGDSVSADYSSSCNQWNTAKGVNASTTGTIYGIYDMNGGSFEWVMGNMVNSSGAFYPSTSGLSQPESKYYDSYAYGTSDLDYSRGYLGDATKEVLENSNSNLAWNNDSANFVYSNYPWITRGGYPGSGTHSGIFYFSYDDGDENPYNSFRVVLVAE